MLHWGCDVSYFRNRLYLACAVQLASWILGAIAVLLLIALAIRATEAAEPPPASVPYRATLTREARALWGLDAPVAVLAAQVQTESAWNPNARSKFAAGLAQFTPATAQWISGAYPSSLAADQPLNPAWALRALARYDYDLVGGITWAKGDCDKWAFALSEYNGGPPWLARDVALCGRTAGCDPTRWWGNVELHSQRYPAFFKENRGYPTRILILYQKNYTSWGGGIACPASDFSV